MSERIRMSDRTLDLLLFATSSSPDKPRSVFASLVRSWMFCGVPVVADNSLPLGNFYRERTA